MVDSIAGLQDQQAMGGIVQVTKNIKVNWQGRPESNNIEDRRNLSAAEEQANIDTSTAEDVLRSMKDQSPVPLPRPRPNPDDVLKFDEDAWVSGNATDAAEQVYKKKNWGIPYWRSYGLPFGDDYKEFEGDFEKQVNNSQFLLDSFKRARSAGLPLPQEHFNSYSSFPPSLGNRFEANN